MIFYEWHSLFLITVALTVNGVLAFRADIRKMRSSYICEKKVMHLHCNSPDVLEIHGADYGVAADICQNGQKLHQPCTVADRTQRVKSWCDNQPECSIEASSSIFGDPCPGLHKYLNVIYACVKPIHTDTIATTTAAPTSGIATTEGIPSTHGTTLGMSIATTANITQPPNTESTEGNEKQATRQAGEVLAKKEIPVFDPSNSVMLESFSDSSQSMSFCVAGFLSWICAFSVVAVWCL